MNMDKRKVTMAKALLFGATLIWGSSFVIMKDTLSDIPVFYLLSMRFISGALVVLLLSIKKLPQLNPSYFIKGSIMGFLLFMGYVTQTFGLKDTTPGKNAFLTTVYCIIVPFLYWGFGHVRPDRFNIIASFICVAGIGLVSLNEKLTMRMGDVLTLICGFFYAAHIVSIAVFSRKNDILLLTLIQFATAGALGGIFGALFETFPSHLEANSIWSLAYLCLFATAAAMLMQNIGQKYTPPSSAALIMSLEAVFGVLFSILLYHEQLTLRIIAGFVLIFAAVIISETKLIFLKNLRK